jgi:hypothetical protein
MDNYDDVEDFIRNKVEGKKNIGTVIDEHMQMQIMHVERQLPNFQKATFIRNSIQNGLTKINNIDWPDSLKPRDFEFDNLSSELIETLSGLSGDKQKALLELLR